MPLICELFPTTEADRILSITLTASVGSDLLVWLGDPSGSYSVRSGYRMLHWPSRHFSSPLSTTTSPCFRALFTCIWKARVPPKVLITVWRFLGNYVPTLHALYNRFISAIANCPRCQTLPETSLHVLYDYSFVSLTWERLCISWDSTYNGVNMVS